MPFARLLFTASLCGAVEVLYSAPLPYYYTEPVVAVDVRNNEAIPRDVTVTGCGGVTPLNIVATIPPGDTIRYSFTLNNAVDTVNCMGEVDGVAVAISGSAVRVDVIPTIQKTAKPVVHAVDSGSTPPGDSITTQCMRHASHPYCVATSSPGVGGTAAPSSSSPSMGVSVISGLLSKMQVEVLHPPHCGAVGVWDDGLMQCVGCVDSSCTLPGCRCEANVTVQCVNGVFDYAYQGCVCGGGWRSSPDASIRLVYCDIQNLPQTLTTWRDGEPPFITKPWELIALLITCSMLLLASVGCIVITATRDGYKYAVLTAAWYVGVIVTRPVLDSKNSILEEAVLLPIPPPWFLEDMCNEPPLSPVSRTEPIHDETQE